jgi:hypothetical protein
VYALIHPGAAISFLAYDGFSFRGSLD